MTFGYAIFLECVRVNRHVVLPPRDRNKVGFTRLTLTWGNTETNFGVFLLMFVNTTPGVAPRLLRCLRDDSAGNH